MIDLLANTQSLHPREQSLSTGRRIFTARVWRAKATYTFTARSFVRLVSQYVETTRDPDLFVLPVTSCEAQLTGTALFAYKINWQSDVLRRRRRPRYVPERRLTPAGHQLFLKLSYAFQR